MKFSTISSKTYLASGLFTAISAISCIIGFSVAGMYSKDVKGAAISSGIMRDVMTADMMHDGLRADALNALLSINPETMVSTPKEVAADIEEHSKTFSEAISSAKSAISNQKVKALFAKAEGPLNEYLDSANDIANAAINNPSTVPSLMAPFRTRFEHLEVALEELSGAIEEEVNRDAKLANGHIVQSMIALAIALALSILGALIIVFTARKQIIKPISEITEAMNSLANGNLEIEAPVTEKGGELDALSQSLLTFKENAIQKKKFEESEKFQVLERQERSRKIEDITNEFAAQLSDSLVTLSSTAQELQASATQMGSMAMHTKNLTSEASNASTEASDSVNTIASATTELNATVEQIAEQMRKSSDIAGRAAKVGKETEDSVTGLKTAVSEINEVLALISAVSEQTNLLALNATIEAARAGEAGKGFAVVASEVKGLASQTAKATTDIEAKIENVSLVSEKVAESVNNVVRMVEDMYQLSQSVTISVEEQSAATSSIAESACIASSGTNAATENVIRLQESAEEAADASNALNFAAGEVAEKSSLLRKSADEFFAKIRSA